jgi:hypothetical protein
MADEEEEHHFRRRSGERGHSQNRSHHGIRSGRIEDGVADFETRRRSFPEHEVINVSRKTEIEDPDTEEIVRKNRLRRLNYNGHDSVV